MTAPNVPTITASIERSLLNCSLSSDPNNPAASAAASPGARSAISGSSLRNTTPEFAYNTLELNSQIRLPCYWEQCLDLKTGEVYYINWRTGMRSSYDPRVMMNPAMNINIGGGGGAVGRLLSSEDEAKEEDNDQRANDRLGSSTEEEEESRSPSSSSRTCRSEQYHYNIPTIPSPSLHGECESSSNDHRKQRRQEVLVVAGCKGCFMYFMVAKQVEDCPKCFGQLLHFDRSQNGSP